MEREVEESLGLLHKAGARGCDLGAEGDPQVCFPGGGDGGWG